MAFPFYELFANAVFSLQKPKSDAMSANGQLISTASKDSVMDFDVEHIQWSCESVLIAYVRA